MRLRPLILWVSIVCTAIVPIALIVSIFELFGDWTGYAVIGHLIVAAHGFAWVILTAAVGRDHLPQLMRIALILLPASFATVLLTSILATKDRTLLAAILPAQLTLVAFVFGSTLIAAMLLSHIERGALRPVRALAMTLIVTSLAMILASEWTDFFSVASYDGSMSHEMTVIRALGLQLLLVALVVVAVTIGAGWLNRYFSGQRDAPQLRFKITCPRCQMKQHVQTGGDSCIRCRLKITVRVA